MFGMLLFLSVASVVACAAQPWENPAVNAENRLEARAHLPPDKPFAMSLNGKWSFTWEGSADGAIATNTPDRIETPFEIDVPCCVETRGWGVPHYTNIRYPHGMTPPKIDPKYNPTMLYRRTFEIPETWSGRRIVLRFEGVASCAEIWLNGNRIGYFEDARMPSEFDITPYCKLKSQVEVEERTAKHSTLPLQLKTSTDNSNTLCVRVRKWCDGSYVEDQDMIRYAGIFRDVVVYAEAKDGVCDVVVTTVPDRDYKSWIIELELERALKSQVEVEERTEASLFDAAGNKAGDLTPLFNFNSKLQLQLAPRLWSDEDPYLYTLVVRRNGDERKMRVGFRDCRVEKGLILVNGRPVKFKGVNRHEMSVENGYTVSYGQMLADVKLMKRNNINMVRTSHYPFDPRFYDLCDEYGLYVCAEANVEAHEMGYAEDCVMERPEWEHTIVERNVRQVKAYRNHPSVVMWSFGNESGWGRNVAAVRKAIRALDPTTPFHGVGWKSTKGHPFGPVWDDSDMTGGQYSGLDWIRARIDDPKPFFLMEYSCAMGNGMGNHREYWDLFYSSDKLSGGCIWDWIDQAMWIDTDRTDASGKRIRYLGYGGDHDEQPNDGPYCANGLLDALRRPSAKLNEVKHVQQPVEVGIRGEKGERGEREGQVSRSRSREGEREGQVSRSRSREDDNCERGEEAEFWNRYEFTYADDELDGVWELSADGIVVDRGSLEVPHVAPRARGKIVLPKPHVALDPAKEHFYRVSFRLKRDRPWAAKGYEVAWNQLPYGKVKVKGEGEQRRVVNSILPLQLDTSTNDLSIIVTAGTTKAVFSRATGTLSELTMNGKTVIADKSDIVHGPRLQVARAFTDSDNWMRKPFVAAGLSHLTAHPMEMRVEENKVTCSVRMTGAMSGGFDFVAAWTFRADGTILVRNEMMPFGHVPELPRVGVFMMLDGALENMRYYGRGPYENAIDRCTGCDIAQWQSTVTEQYVDYIRPQDCGGKTDVRWVTFTDPKDGRGVKFTAVGMPMMIQALHFTRDDLDQSRHRPGDCHTWSEPRRYNPLVPRKEVCLSLDCRQTGLGCNNCGPIPLPQYRFKIEPIAWSYEIAPEKVEKGE